MAVNTPFKSTDFVNILSLYNLGKYTRSDAIQQGTVQTNFFIQTTQGKFVFRYYENRSKESVLFESNLLEYLAKRHYPCPSQFKNTQDTYVGMYRNKPYIIFEFIEGRHIEHPSAHHKQQLVQKAAELQKLTKDFFSRYTPHRWNYDPELCLTLARVEATSHNTKSAQEKFAWLAHELSTLDLPPSLPKGICHCDFHFSNILFQEDEFVALIDFDDANYTFLQFDLVVLIDYWAWPHTADIFDVTKARSIVQEYMKHRPLTPIEQKHLYDVNKLSILFDCVWYFRRGAGNDFLEKKKIDTLSNLGRQKFFNELFHK